MAEFAKGSTIVCPACQVPIYVLEGHIDGSMKAGRAAHLFRPIRLKEIYELVTAERPDLPAGWRLMVRHWADSSAVRSVVDADRPRAGDPALCPHCGDTFVTVVDREYGTAEDKAYELQLWDIPPAPAVDQISQRKQWMAKLPLTVDGISDPVVIKKDGRVVD